MRIRSLVAALAAGLAVTSLFAPVPAQAQQKFITVGTGGIVGVYYPLGGAICRFVNAGRKDHNLRCTVESTGGSVFNINAVMAGDMDVGFAQSDTQFYAMKGIGTVQGQAAAEAARAVLGVSRALHAGGAAGRQHQEVRGHQGQAHQHRRPGLRHARRRWNS